jgi:hypothetical protein
MWKVNRRPTKAHIIWLCFFILLTITVRDLTEDLFLLLWLAHWNNSLLINRHVAPLWHIILISSQPGFAHLLNAACLLESYKYQFHSLVWHDRGSNPRSTTLEVSTLIITPPMLFYCGWLYCLVVLFNIIFSIVLPIWRYYTYSS